MRNAIRSVVLSALLAFPVPRPLHAQTIQGAVFDGDTGHPVANASVVLLGKKGEILRGTQSEAKGSYSLTVPEPGTYTLRVGTLGYVTWDSRQVQVRADQTLEMDITIWTSDVDRAAVLQRLGQYAVALESFEPGTFGRSLVRYISSRPERAIALARDSAGRWASGYASGYPTRAEAVERAMSQCVNSTVQRRMRSQCQLYAVGDEVVWGKDALVQETPSERASVRVPEFGKGGCAEWSDYGRIMGSGGPVITWRWRLCDYTDDQYDIRVEFRNPTDRNIEFSYRFASVPAPCDNIDAAVDRLSLSLSGQLRLRPEERKRHRGRRGSVDKDHWTGYFNLCVYNLRSFR